MLMYLSPAVRRVFKRDMLSALLWQAMVSGIFSFAVVHAKRMGAPAILVGLFVAMGFFPFSVAWIPRLLSRYIALGKLLIGLRLLASTSVLIAALFPTRDVLVVTALFSLFFAPLSDTLYPAIFRVIYPRKHHVALMSTIYMVKVFAGALIMVIVGRLLDILSLQQGIVLLGSLGLLGLGSVVVWWPFRHAQETEILPVKEKGEVNPPKQNKEFQVFLRSITIYGIGNCIGGFCMPVLMADKNAFAFSNSQIGVIIATGLVVQVFTSAWFTRYGRVTASARHMGLPWILQGMAMFASGIMLMIPGGRSMAFIPVLIGVALNNMGIGLQLCAHALLVNAMAGEASAMRYHSVQYTVIGVRGVLVPIIASWAYQYVPLWVLVWLSFVLFVSGGVAALRWGAPIPEDDGEITQPIQTVELPLAE